MMAAKLGLTHLTTRSITAIRPASQQRDRHDAVFRALADVRQDDTDLMQPLTEAYYNSADTQGKAAATMRQWVEDYLHEAKQQDRVMKNVDVNERYKPQASLRNYLPTGH